MASIIFGNDENARGCYREIMGTYAKGRSAYLTLPNIADFPNDSNGAPITDPYFISNVSFAQKEKYHIVQCFNDRNYVYAFGHDPMASLLEITFTMFLAKAKGQEFGGALETMVGAYNMARLSQNPEYAVFTLGSVSLVGFVVGMTSATQDLEHNLQSITFHLLLVEAQTAYPSGAAAPMSDTESATPSTGTPSSGTSTEAPGDEPLPTSGITVGGEPYSSPFPTGINVGGSPWVPGLNMPTVPAWATSPGISI